MNKKSETTLKVQNKCHPDYDAMAPYYEDCYYLISKGDAKTVKEQKEKYLKKLMSQVRNDTWQGDIEYAEYLDGAVWSEIPKESVNNILGEMFSRPSTLKLPKVFQEYESNITSDANGLNFLEANTTIGQLEFSRIGLMAYTMPDKTGTKLPKVALYNALDIYNWHQVMNPELGEIVYDLVELRSQSYEMNPETLEYEQVVKYIIHGVSPEGKYYKVTIKEEDYENVKISYEKRRAYGKKNKTYIEPTFKGFNLNYVPFVAINASNVDGQLDIPVLYSQVDLALHAYKNSALFSKKLKLQTWALLLLAGYSQSDIDQGVKADGVLPSSSPDSKGQYLTPSSDSLLALKEAWETSEERARNKGIQISEKAQVESGIALEKRIKNQSNAFRRIVEVRNEGILKLLSYIVDWGSMGLTVENDWITPFMDFNTNKIMPEDVVKMGSLVLQGVYSTEDYYNYLKKYGYTQHKDYLSFSAELGNSNYED